MLRFRSLGSGSSGNATLVEAGSGALTRRLLVDCGLGLKQLDQRLEQAGLAAGDLDAVFITHEHGDHIGSARRLAHRDQLPVWMSAGTHAGIGNADFGAFLRIASDGETIDLGELCVLPFTVPHDAREPLQLRCSDGAVHLGILTDIGHATAHALSHLARCDALLLECNHDAELLAASSYPAFLKKRVGGQYGHLSNACAAEIARQLRHPGLHTVVAAHLSLQNNRPELARTALSEALQCAAADIGVADPVSGTGWITL